MAKVSLEIEEQRKLISTVQTVVPPRGKKILEQLSIPRFFPAFEISRPFSHLFSTEKRAENFKTRKKSWS